MKTDSALEEQVTQIAKLLSDETRVRILIALRGTDGMCVNEVAETVGASQSATSHQLAKLELAGVVSCYREGQKMCYELEDTPVTKKIISTLHVLT